MKKSPKIHAEMTKQEFIKLLEYMRFGLSDLSLVTGIPYRTLQDYKSGARSISVERAIQLRNEAKRHQKIRQEVYRGIEKRAAREFPDGLISEVDDNEW